MKEKEFSEKTSQLSRIAIWTVCLLSLPLAIVTGGTVHGFKASCEADGMSVSEGFFNLGYAVMLFSPFMGLVIGLLARRWVRWQILSILIGIFAWAASMVLGLTLIGFGVS